ncbi:MAG: DUF499 domain-containing protein [Deltaproteobacteria bacterium]|nr:DUF499 domain-containing protein [Deltaproteobacteria bacterium]
MNKRDNHGLVNDGFGILLSVLAPYLVVELRNALKKKWWELGVLAKLESDHKRELPSFGSDEELVAKLDIQGCLLVLRSNWRDIFGKKLSKEHLAWANELIGLRNSWAHIGSEDFSEDKAFRALDTMALLCQQIDSPKAAEIKKLQMTVRLGGSVGAKAANPEPTPPTRANERPTEARLTTTSGGQALLGWRNIILPHPDVSEGRYKSAEFAVDLAQVARGEGAIEYLDPEEFFARTYLTEGVKGLVVQGLKRLAGVGGEPVIQLKTAFGGGKTHSMLALCHLTRGEIALDKVPSLRTALASSGIISLPKAQVVILVGTALDPTKAKTYPQLPGETVSTLWGEIGAQLAITTGLTDLYPLVREADRKGVSPGSETFKELFDLAGPCLILIDELVAYGRRLYGVQGLSAGSFDNFLTFIQSLTEGVRASANSLVVATLPESNLEIGGEAGQKTLETIEHVFGRLEHIWKPVDSSEGFEVVRRRLFLDCENVAGRDRVCEAFFKMYQRNSSDFPVTAKDTGYLNRLKACYPIHPEVFDRLYDDWSALDRFQRTRGVLRLMAGVIHELWMVNDPSLLIMPGSIPFDLPVVRDELTRYLSEGWNSVVDGDVDGEKSKPFLIDEKKPRYGQLKAARRVARTVMLGSAPASREHALKGVQKTQTILGVAQPGEEIAIFRDALSALQDSLTYLYSNPSGDRFWYDTRPTLRKVMEEKADQIQTEEIESELERRLKGFRNAPPFAGISHSVNQSRLVLDDSKVRLVVLRYDHAYKNGDVSRPIKDSGALAKALNILETCGDSDRTNRNMLVFLAADNTDSQTIHDSTSKYLAWLSIKNDKDTLNLDQNQIKEVEANLVKSDETVKLQLNAAYCWLLCPYSEVEGDETHLIKFDVSKLVGGPDEPIKKVINALKNNGTLIDQWSSKSLLLAPDKFLWGGDDRVEIKTLWKRLCSYCYMPRLANYEVLVRAIIQGVGEKDFGYAEDFQNNRYQALKLGHNLTEVKDSGFLVKLKAAQQQIDEDKELAPGPNALPKTGSALSDDSTSPQTPPAPAKRTKFILSADLPFERIISKVKTISDEILSLVSTGSSQEELSVSLEVVVTQPDGFDVQTEKNVLENCHTLEIRSYHFEK